MTDKFADKAIDRNSLPMSRAWIDKKPLALSARPTGFIFDCPGGCGTYMYLSWAELKRRGRRASCGHACRNVVSELRPRKPLEPGRLSANHDAVYWPEHPIANGSGMLALTKLEFWQELGCADWAAEKMKGLTSRLIRENIVLGGPVSFREVQDGYIEYRWTHPLGGRCGGKFVREHWVVFLQENDYADWVIEAKGVGATIHHLNGIRDDNRIENLELRWPGKHPRGWTTNTMIETLRGIGYKVTK